MRVSKGFFNRPAARKYQYGGYAFFLTAIVLAAVIFANLMLGLWESRGGLKIDLSPQRLTSVSGQTEAVLKGLADDIHVHPVYKAGTASDLRLLISGTLDRYRAISSHILVETIDPATQPNRVAALAPEGGTVPEGTVFVTTADATRVIRIDSGDFMYKRTLEGKVYSLYGGEIRLTSAIMNAAGGRTPSAGFLTGHGEISQEECSVLKMQLEASGYIVSVRNANAESLAGCDVLLLLSPRTDLTVPETEALKKWLDTGGRLLAVYGAETPQEKLFNFGVLLDLYGLGFLKGQTVESPGNTENYVDRPDLIKPVPAATHEITAPVTQRLILPAACAVAPPGIRTGIATENILTTSSQAYRKADTAGDLYTFSRGDASGTQTLALAAAGPADMRIILLASAEMLTDKAGITGADLLNASDNLKFLTSCVNWLSGNSSLTVSADLKVIPTHLMTFESEQEKQRISILAIAVLPTLSLAAGLAMAIRRRRL